MTKLKVFSLLPALLLASIVHAWEAPEIRELSAAEIQPKHESLQPHKSLVAQLDPTFGIRALALSTIFLPFREQERHHLSHPAYLPEKGTLLPRDDCHYTIPSQKLSNCCAAPLES